MKFKINQYHAFFIFIKCEATFTAFLAASSLIYDMTLKIEIDR